MIVELTIDSEGKKMGKSNFWMMSDLIFDFLMKSVSKTESEKETITFTDTLKGVLVKKSKKENE